MSQFVTDTHPLIWHLTGDARLSIGARKTEKGIVPQPMLERTLELLDTSDGSYAVPPLDQAVARSMLQQVPWKMIPELADRIIVASALALGVPLISKDEKIQTSGLLSVIW
jgi:PIN domain nuclease of toxin-antitoxin system